MINRTQHRVSLAIVFLIAATALNSSSGATATQTQTLSPPLAIPKEEPKVKENPKSESWLATHKNNCQKFYPGQIQVGINRACAVGGRFFRQSFMADSALRARALPSAQTGCRLQYGEEPSETAACLVGAYAAKELTYLGELSPSNSDVAKAFSACSDVYLVRTELDSYLLESCLTGALAPTFASGSTASSDYCAVISPERGFLGPCRVGLTLSPSSLVPQATSGPSATASTDFIDAKDHRQQCEKHFDHLRFHMGYRNCIIGRSVALELGSAALTVGTLKAACDFAVSDNSNDHERGACIVGATLAQKKVLPHFERCGISQVTYQDRDFLGCLAAASFVAISSAKQADSACREIFRDKKSLVRSACVASLPKLSDGSPAAVTPPAL